MILAELLVFLLINSEHLGVQQPQTDHDNGYLGEILCLLGMGLFNTYDLAKRDTEGNYQITGRVDDAIRIKGVWLEVPKIESVMVRI